jgi:hypothetical protein
MNCILSVDRCCKVLVIYASGFVDGGPETCLDAGYLRICRKSSEEAGQLSDRQTELEVEMREARKRRHLKARQSEQQEDAHRHWRLKPV